MKQLISQHKARAGIKIVHRCGILIGEFKRVPGRMEADIIGVESTDLLVGDDKTYQAPETRISTGRPSWALISPRPLRTPCVTVQSTSSFILSLQKLLPWQVLVRSGNGPLSKQSRYLHLIGSQGFRWNPRRMTSCGSISVLCLTKFPLTILCWQPQSLTPRSTRYAIIPSTRPFQLILILR